MDNASSRGSHPDSCSSQRIQLYYDGSGYRLSPAHSVRLSFAMFTISALVIAYLTTMLFIRIKISGNLCFDGGIPSGIGACTSLARLWLNSSRLVALILENLTTLPNLLSLKLDNNNLMGPIPKVKFENFTYGYNSFCESTAGVSCTLAVTMLLEFLGDVNYPVKLASSWRGNDLCTGGWFGVSCSRGKVSVINLPNLSLGRRISPSLGELGSLVDIRLGGNNLSGTISANLTGLIMLRMLNVSTNNLAPLFPNLALTTCK